MSGKLSKVRVEIERRYNEYMAKDSELAAIRADECLDILSFIDSMQEEPTSVWHDASEIPKFRKEFLAIVYTPTDVLKYVKTIYSEDEYCLIENDKWAYIDDILKLSNIQRTIKNEEPVSEDLDKAARADAMVERSDDTEVGYDLNRYDGFIAGAKWQKEKEYTCYEEAFEDGAKWKVEQMMAKAVDGEVTYGKSLAIPSLGYRLDKEGLDFGDKVKVIVIKED